MFFTRLKTGWRQFSATLVLLFVCLYSGESVAGEKLHIGGDSGFQPYEFMDTSGRPAGFTVELFQAVCHTMGLEVEIFLRPWGQVRRDLETGKLDGVMGMFYSAARDVKVDFCSPFLRISYSIFVRKGSTIANLADLKGLRVLVHEGDVMHDHLDRTGLAGEIVPAENPGDALRALAAGRCDCALLNKFQGLYLADLYNLENVETVGSPFFSTRYCFAVREGDETLLSKLNEGLMIIRETGQYDEIYDRWFGAYTPHAHWKQILLYGALVMAPVVVLLLVVLAWSWSLRRTVALRTQQLEKEMQERYRAEEKQRELEREMLQAQKLESLGTMAGGIAHDFNNLLMGILGNADLLMSDLPLDSPFRKNLRDIEQSATSAAELCAHMLAYSGKGRFLIKSVNLSDLVQNTRTLFEASIPKTVTLSYSLAEPLPAIEADESQIRQIICNLVANSAEAIEGKSGMISIRTGTRYYNEEFIHACQHSENGEPGTYVFLSVSDTGCGIAQEERDKIFDPFFSTKFTGRGLGLAAVSGIVRSHKGFLHVISEPGKGSTFSILFPASTVAPHEEPVKESFPVSAGDTNTILLVDDETIVRKVASHMLKKAGYKVLIAENGTEAVQIFTKEHDDIAAVLLDVSMPDGNGQDAFFKMRKIDQSVPVVLSSGYEKREVLRDFSDKMPAGFLQKPYTQQYLLEILEKILGKASESYSSS